MRQPQPALQPRLSSVSTPDLGIADPWSSLFISKPLEKLLLNCVEHATFIDLDGNWIGWLFVRFHSLNFSSFTSCSSSIWHRERFTSLLTQFACKTRSLAKGREGKPPRWNYYSNDKPREQSSSIWPAASFFVPSGCLWNCLFVTVVGVE